MFIKYVSYINVHSEALTHILTMIQGIPGYRVTDHTKEGRAHGVYNTQVIYTLPNLTGF